MKTLIWSMTDEFPGKVNIIDTENVLLGYDLHQSCCEDARWSIGPNKDGSNPIHEGDEGPPQKFELEGYTFDPEFYEEEEDGSTNIAIFRLISLEADLFIRISNTHNGYYCHGFTFTGGKGIESSL